MDMSTSEQKSRVCSAVGKMLPRMLRHAPEYAAAWMSLNFLSNGLRSVLLHPDDSGTSNICENFPK